MKIGQIFVTSTFLHSFTSQYFLSTWTHSGKNHQKFLIHAKYRKYFIFAKNRLSIWALRLEWWNILQKVWDFLSSALAFANHCTTAHCLCQLNHSYFHFFHLPLKVETILEFKELKIYLLISCGIYVSNCLQLCLKFRI